MCVIFGVECLEYQDKRSKIVVSELKSTYIGNNKKQKEFCLYRVDACLIGEGEKKCDYLLLDANAFNSYFVELKGSDLIAAVEQIDATLTTFNIKLKNFTPFGRIVLTRVNTTQLRSPKYLKLQKRLKDKGGDLKQQTNILEEEL